MIMPVSYTHLRAHETRGNLVCRLLLEKKKHVKRLGTSLGGQTRVSVGLDARLQGRAKRTPRGAGRSSSRPWLEFSESKNLTAESREQKNE